MCYITFHIGRGGRFNNAGYKTFYDAIDFQELIRRESNNLYYDEDSFCYTDAFGNILIDAEKSESYSGVLDYDGEYDTFITKRINNLSEEEILIVLRDKGYEYLIGDDLIDFLDLIDDEFILTQIDDNLLRELYHDYSRYFAENSIFKEYVNKWYSIDEYGDIMID